MKYLYLLILCYQLTTYNCYSQSILGDSIFNKIDTNFYSSNVNVLYYSNSRKIIEKYETKNGMKNGIYIYYYINGKPYMIGHYLNNIKDGYWYTYTSCGRLELIVLYKEGIKKNSYTYPQTNTINHIQYEVCCNDTINCIDTLNLKQGIWITYGQAEGKLRFFKIYKDDCLISDILVYNANDELEKINVPKDDYFIPYRKDYSELWDEYYYKNRILIDYAEKHIQCNR